MTDEERLPSSRSDEAHREASDFQRVERAGFEAMAARPDALDEDGRTVTDPGQDARAPEEQPGVRQAGPDADEQRADLPEASR